MRCWIPIIVVLTGSLASCSVSEEVAVDSTAATTPKTTATTAPTTPDAAQVAADYEHLTLMTKEPVQVGGVMIAQCAPPPLTAGAAAARYGPHAQGSIRIFMNGLAADAFAKP